MFLMALVLQGCPPPRVPTAPTGGLRFEGEPLDARVYVNEKLSGTLELYVDRPLLLRPGKYRVKLTADGYYPEYREIEVGDEIVPVTVTLTAVPEPLGVQL
jgi:hypothetical protein